MKSNETNKNPVTEVTNINSDITSLGWDDPAILCEDKNRRSAHAKEFIKNNRTRKVVISAEPMNYFDETEQRWRTIDNSLEECDDHYEAKLGRFKAKIVKAERGSGVEVVGDGMKLSWSFLGRETDKDHNKNKKREKKTSLNVTSKKKSFSRGNVSSRVLYENCEDDLDIEYALHSNNVKENIIIRKAEEFYRYRFAFHTEGLAVRLAEDKNSLEIISTTTDENGAPCEKREFAIPAPFMFDATGTRSDEVHFELEEIEEGEYTFTVVANEKWINDPVRVFPVTIDPELECSASNKFLTATQCTEVYCDTCGGSCSDCTTDMTHYYIAKNECSTTRTKFTFNKTLMGDDIRALSNGIITNVSFFMSVIASPIAIDPTAFSLSGINPTLVENTRMVRFDITEQMKSTQSGFSLTLEPTVLGAEYHFYKTGENAPYIEVEYIARTKDRPTKKRIPLVGGAEMVVDLQSGDAVTVIPDRTEDSGIAISHVFKAEDGESLYGKNFHLTLNERLVKNTDDTDKTTGYVYTDALGDQHLLNNYYFYIDADGVKQPITVDDVTADVDGSLRYADGETIYPVFRETISDSGWEAITQLEDVTGCEWIEQRSDEEKQLEEQKKAYEDTLKSFVHIKKIFEDKEIEELKSAEKRYNYPESDSVDFLDDYDTAINPAPNWLLMTKNDATAYKSLINQRQSLIDQKNALASQSYTTYLSPISKDNTIDDTIELGLKFESLTNLYRQIYNIDVNGIPNIENSSHLYSSNEYEIAELSVQQIPKALDINLEQINVYHSQAEKNIEICSKYYKEYLNLDAKLESLRLHTPVNYLRKDGMIKGFNADGDLVVIFDSYGNYHALAYDKRTVDGEEHTYITGIVDQDERQTVFNYNANLQLTSIVTPNGDRTEYEYSAEKLSRILYSDGTALKLITSAKTVTQIKSSEKQYVAVLYDTSDDTGYKVSNVTVYSEVESISHNNTVENTLSVSKTKLTYDENKTTVTDAYDNQEIYVFDTNPDCLKEFYTIIDGKVTGAERYTYADYDYDLDFSIVESADENTLNSSDYSQFSFVTDKFARVDYDKYRRAIREETTWKHSVISAAKPCVITHHTYDEAHHLLKSVSEVYHLAKNPPTYTTVTTYQYNGKGSVVRSESYVDGRQLTEGINIEEHEYDDKGREVRTISYNTLDASSKFYAEREYDEDGKLVSEPDATGKHKTSYRYAAGDGKLLGEILPNGSEFAYGYDEAGHVTAITHSTEDGEENANNTAYTYGCSTEVRSGNNVVHYTYDGKRRITAVDLNGVENYVTYAYEDVTVDGKKAEKVTATMKDGSTSVVIKDLNGNTLSTTITGKTVTYDYDNKNRLTAISGRLNGASETFTYDTLDNLSGYVYNNGSNVASESYIYNTDRQLASKTVDGKTYTYAYKDNTAKSLESVSVDGFTFSPKLDCLGRNKGKTIEANGNKLAEEQITYLKFGDHATNIPATVYYGDKKNGSYAFSDHFKYKYDSMGNITEIRENGELYAKYTYDAIGRLVREDNKKLGKTTTFTYDTNGNILCRKEYPFTLLETEKLDELDSDTFTYTYDGDKMLSYNGEECTYDAIGNPEKYRGLDADFDNGRQLTSFDGNTFTYDNLGRRISKRISKDDGTTETITFTYDANGNLIRQSNGISFIYDASGVCGLTYSDATYFHRKDILGNIVALLNADGEIVAKYTYDAWGNHTITATEGNETIANLNPFRYRGYYYDVETGLYFLKTRYYDPETGRFITIDDISYLDPDSINGLNLYAYCRNNPVMCVDPSGHWIETILDIGFALWSLFDFLKEPSWLNALWLGLDIVALIVPFLPGGSKVITKADDLVDAVEFVNKHDEVIVLGQSMKDRVAPYADEIGAMIYGGVDNFNDLAKAYGTVTATFIGYFDNMGFIVKHSLTGAKFIDKGFDASRTIKGLKGLDLFAEVMSRITIYSEKFFAQLFRKKNLYRYLRHKLF